MRNEDEYAEIKVGRRGGKGQGAREQKDTLEHFAKSMNIVSDKEIHVNKFLLLTIIIEFHG